MIILRCIRACDRSFALTQRSRRSASKAEANPFIFLNAKSLLSLSYTLSHVDVTCKNVVVHATNLCSFAVVVASPADDIVYQPEATTSRPSSMRVEFTGFPRVFRIEHSQLV